jgi:hypothetical protein
MPLKESCLASQPAGNILPAALGHQWSVLQSQDRGGFLGLHWPVPYLLYLLLWLGKLYCIPLKAFPAYIRHSSANSHSE